MHPERLFLSRGSALLLVLWSLVLLSMSVFGVVEIVQSSVTHSSHLELEAQARALAMSGLAVALHPQMEQTDSLLHQQPATGQKWAVTLHGEAGRLNLNYVLSSGHLEILTHLFTLWGLKYAEAQYAANCLYNWITPENPLPGQTNTGKPNPPDGKRVDYERAKLTRFPTGRPFTSLSEATFVLGMDAVEKANPDWQNSFTLWSDGPLDINEASPELLAAVFNLPLSQTQDFVKTRNGKDEIQETPDDVTIPNETTLKSALGLSTETLKSLANQISYADSIRRIQSKGEANGVTVTISAITRLKSSPPEYLLWTEL